MVKWKSILFVIKFACLCVLDCPSILPGVIQHIASFPLTPAVMQSLCPPSLWLVWTELPSLVVIPEFLGYRSCFLGGCNWLTLSENIWHIFSGDAQSSCSVCTCRALMQTTKGKPQQANEWLRA